MIHHTVVIVTERASNQRTRRNVIRYVKRTSQESSNELSLSWQLRS